MVPESVAQVEGPNLTQRLIRPEDADYVDALRTDPAYNRHLKCAARPRINAAGSKATRCVRLICASFTT